MLLIPHLRLTLIEKSWNSSQSLGKFLCSVYINQMTNCIIGSQLLFLFIVENVMVSQVPPEKYSAERIIQILLDPNIDKSKVCTQRPLNVDSSCTFVVDLDQLLEADDVKKDKFGVWNHSGSQPQV